MNIVHFWGYNIGGIPDIALSGPNDPIVKRVVNERLDKSKRANEVLEKSKGKPFVYTVTVDRLTSEGYERVYTSQNLDMETAKLRVNEYLNVIADVPNSNVDHVLRFWTIDVTDDGN